MVTFASTRLGSFERALERASIATAASIYVVDDEDAANIQFTLAALKLRPDIARPGALSTSAIAARAMLDRGAPT